MRRGLYVRRAEAQGATREGEMEVDTKAEVDWAALIRATLTFPQPVRSVFCLDHDLDHDLDCVLSSVRVRYFQVRGSQPRWVSALELALQLYVADRRSIPARLGRAPGYHTPPQVLRAPGPQPQWSHRLPRHLHLPPWHFSRWRRGPFDRRDFSLAKCERPST